MRNLIGCLIALCAGTVGAQAMAAVPTTAPTIKKAAKKTAGRKAAPKPAEPKLGPLLDEDGKAFEVGTAAVTELNCELGNRLTLYRNTTDNDHMGLRWNQRVMQMTRVSTTTGANRFENTKVGLIWIGIPAKGMLLDSKRGQQLANECKDTEQMAGRPAAALTPTKSAGLPGPIATPRADGKPDS